MMKTLILSFLCCCFAVLLRAQAPQGIPYQSALRNNSGAILANQVVSIRFSIRDSSLTGTIVYQETHGTTTNAQGMVSLTIGQGTASTGVFSSINWGQHAKFLQVEMDPAGGTSYVDLGTQQMMSVPYALYAGSAGNITGGTASFAISEFSASSPNNLTYFEAVEYCRNLVENGHSDWRLPTADQVENYIEINGWSSINSYLWTTTRPEYNSTIRISYHLYTSSPVYVEIADRNYLSAQSTQCVR